MIELCKWYTTTGHYWFKPRCLKGLRVSLKCHSRRADCPLYTTEDIENETSREAYEDTKRSLKEDTDYIIRYHP